MVTDGHDVSLMDLKSVDGGIAHRIGDLRGLQGCSRIFHAVQILLGIRLRHEADHRIDALRDVGGGDHDDLTVLHQIPGLFRRENDILVVRQHIDRVGIDLSHRVQHILGAGVHGLSAGDHVVDADPAEDLLQACADGNADKAVGLALTLLFLFRLALLLFIRLLFLLRGDLGSILDQALMVLLAHVVDLHAGKRTVGKALLDREARIIRVHVDLDEFV